MLISQADGRRTVANLLGAAVDTRRGEMRHVLIHQCLAVSRHTRPPVGTIFDY
jgi:hypothetical protein